MAAHRFVLRLPPELFAQLSREAEEQGTSVNQLMVLLLASGVGWTPAGAGEK